MTTEKIKRLDTYTTAFILKQMRNLCGRYELDEPAAPIGGFWYSRNELKEYLATRPHVLNKKESKEARKLRKKSGEKR